MISTSELSGEIEARGHTYGFEPSPLFPIDNPVPNFLTPPGVTVLVEETDPLLSNLSDPTAALSHLLTPLSLVVVVAVVPGTSLSLSGEPFLLRLPPPNLLLFLLSSLSSPSSTIVLPSLLLLLLSSSSESGSNRLRFLLLEVRFLYGIWNPVEVVVPFVEEEGIEPNPFFEENEDDTGRGKG